MVLLQTTEAAGFFDAMMQQGIAFGLMMLIIIVLGRRVLSLEKKIDSMVAEEKADAKESILIIKGATDAMRKVARKLEQ